MENNLDNQFNITNGSGTITTGGNIGTSIGTTTSTTFCIPTYTRKLESVDFIKNEEGNFMEVVYSETPNQQITYTVTWSVPCPGKRMVKERYGVLDGKMQLIKTIIGTEEAGYYVPPSIEWEEE